jgi:hypothetical protein
MIVCSEHSRPAALNKHLSVAQDRFFNVHFPGAAGNGQRHDYQKHKKTFFLFHFTSSFLIGLDILTENGFFRVIRFLGF